MRKSIVAIVCVVCITSLFLVARSNAEPKENPAMPDLGESATSPVRVQEMAPISLFHTTITTSYEKMDVVGPIIESMEKAIRDKQIHATGVVVFLYEGATPDPTKEFQLSIGMPVPAGTEGFDEWKVSDLPAFKCATALHSGPVKSIGLAYQKIFPELFAKGLEPTGENREFYLYWEGEASVNNVMLVQVGVK